MRSRLTCIVAVASVALLAGCAPELPGAVPAGDAVPLFVQDKRDDKRDNLSDAALERLVDPSHPGCSAAVAVDGVVLWAGAEGLADLSSGAPLTTLTRFNMASVSKQFTATAILMLEREGLLSLDDVIGQYVPGLPAWGQTTTLEQLLHHTSHIRDFWQRLQGDGLKFGDYVSHEDIVLAIARLRTLEPGTGYLYSNANYVLLAEVVRAVTGETLPEFLDERIFTPLDLDMEMSPNLKAPDVAVSYDDDEQRQDSGWSAYGYSEIFSTPTELARWADQYRAGTIVDDEFADRRRRHARRRPLRRGDRDQGRRLLAPRRPTRRTRHDLPDLPRPQDGHRRHVQRPPLAPLAGHRRPQGHLVRLTPTKRQKHPAERVSLFSASGW